MIPSVMAQARFLRTKVTLCGVTHGEPLLNRSTDDSKRCASDPDVQAAVATISMMMTMMLGILTCLTTGWWGSVRLRLLSRRRYGPYLGRSFPIALAASEYYRLQLSG